MKIIIEEIGDHIAISFTGKGKKIRPYQVTHDGYGRNIG